MTKTYLNLSGGDFGWFECSMATVIVQNEKLIEFSGGKSFITIILRKPWSYYLKYDYGLRGSRQGSSNSAFLFIHICAMFVRLFGVILQLLWHKICKILGKTTPQIYWKKRLCVVSHEFCYAFRISFYEILPDDCASVWCQGKNDHTTWSQLCFLNLEKSIN